MTEALLTRVKARIPITSRHRSSNLLHGVHHSFVKGRSFDFHDLREYTPGDEVADIDWTASARTGLTVVREHLAERRVRMCLAFPAVDAMYALAPSGERKWEIASIAAGAIGFLAQRAGDEVGAMIGTGADLERTLYRTTETHLESILQLHRQRVHESAKPGESATASDSLTDALATLLATSAHRGCMTVITDSVTITESARQSIAALGARQDLIWLEIADASPFDPPAADASDVHTGWRLETQLRRNRRLRSQFLQAEEHRRQALREAVEATGGVYTVLEHTQDALERTLAVLETRARGRRQ